MAGTYEGGIRARDTNLKKDPNFYKKVGKLGGSTPKTRPSGFAYLKSIGREDLIQQYGRRGGAVSRGGGRPKGVKNRPKVEGVGAKHPHKTAPKQDVYEGRDWSGQADMWPEIFNIETPKKKHWWNRK